MTKNEILNVIDSSYQETMQELANKNLIKEHLSSYADKNGKIPVDKIPAFCVMESIDLNKKFITRIIEKLYESDN